MPATEPAHTMKSTILHLAVIVLVLGPARVHAAGMPFPARPNLIIILTDDQGYHDVGFNGCQDIPTPNSDSISEV
jgi:hypothetical protein